MRKGPLLVFVLFLGFGCETTPAKSTRTPVRKFKKTTTPKKIVNRHIKARPTRNMTAKRPKGAENLKMGDRIMVVLRSGGDMEGTVFRINAKKLEISPFGIELGKGVIPIPWRNIREVMMTERKHFVVETPIPSLPSSEDGPTNDDSSTSPSDGSPDNVRIRKFPNGRMMERITFRPGSTIRHGRFTSWFESGKINEDSHFQDGKRHGSFLKNYPSGKKKMEGSFYKGEQSGEWINYYETGGKQTQGSVEGEEKIGFWTFYHKTGKKMAAGQFRDDKKHGYWEHWYENGKPSGVGKYKNGEKKGPWKEWDARGQVYQNNY